MPRALSLSCLSALVGILLPLGVSAQQPGACEGVSEVIHSGLESVTVVDSTDLTDPLLVTAPPGDTERLFLLGQDGRIWIHRRGAARGELSVFLDIRSRVNNFGNEQGLLGLAFDPDYASTGQFWVNYTESDNQFFGPHFTVVARYSVSSADPDLADPASESRVLRFSQPQSNHNGGQLLFGGDGLLYIATGDGGGGGDQHGTCGNGQDLGTLLGKMLRIDVRGVDPTPLAADCFLDVGNYQVPGGNPFADGAGGACDEVFAYGLRNPWRSDIDPETGEFYLADVGQSCWEEIDVASPAAAKGANFGWRQMEGAHCYVDGSGDCDPAGMSCGSSPDCGDPSLVLPLVEYDHGQGCSITGGHVYRGCRMPLLRGRYFYGDFCSGFVRSFRFSGGEATDPQDHTAQLDPGGLLANELTSFGRDGRGELYVVNRTGAILKILPLFTDLAVSAPGAATPFLLAGDWTWEDLAFETEHPVDFYRVYRAPRPGTAPFECVHATPDATPLWAGGDGAVPDAGTAFVYLVTAVAPDGDETAHGHPAIALVPGNCP